MDWVEIDVTTAEPTDSRALIGLLALAEDRAVDQEMRTFVGSDLVIHTSRLPMPDTFSLTGFRQMAEAFRRGSRSLPSSCEVIAIGCASATIALGLKEITRLVRSVHPETSVIDPVSACLDRLADVGAERVGILTPYASETNGALVGLLQEGGVDVAAGVRLRLPPGSFPAHVPPATVESAIVEADLSGVDALVIFCTALHTVALLDNLEAQLGLPVITTNKALAAGAAAIARSRP